MALEKFLLWQDSYMQAEVFFFHPSTHEQGKWIHDKQCHTEIRNRRSQDLGQFIDGLISSQLYFFKPLGVCIPRKHK